MSERLNPSLLLHTYLLCLHVCWLRLFFFFVFCRLTPVESCQQAINRTSTKLQPLSGPYFCGEKTCFNALGRKAIIVFEHRGHYISNAAHAIQPNLLCHS
ncbi:hypothetical protein F5H01DRAFT_340407 [Linnemannia elongata]|nr:hypothetical protein F5H01DRAFT_340407 [Linnemannia elongata]